MRFAWMLATCAVLAVLAAGCGGDDDTSAATDAETTAAPGAADCSAKLGIVGPLTGDAAAIGTEQLNWAKYALELFNAEHGTGIELVEGDTQLDPAQASTVVQRMIADDDLVAVIGPSTSQGVEATTPLLTRANLAAISPSATRTSLTTSGDNPTFFRVIPNDDAQGPTDANFIADELGAQKVMIIDDQTVYSTGLSDVVTEVLEENGVEIQRESVSQDQVDYSTIVNKMGDDTDVVFVPWQIATNAQRLGQQMAEQGKEGTLFGGDGIFSTDEFTIEGAYVSAFAPDIKGIEEAAELVEGYTSQYGDFGTFGPPTFAATMVAGDAVLAACEDGEATRDEVLEGIRATDVDSSILGTPIRFDEHGDVSGARFYIFQIEDSEYTLVE
jgi:branched-chain amino acid transport system substrate-binding protein